MSGYRNEWPCCGDETYTEAWEPERCPFCELNDAKDRIAELETELEAAQAPASGEVEPVAFQFGEGGQYVANHWPPENMGDATVIPLYRHPPASQVPEAKTARDFYESGDFLLAQDLDACEQQAEGWNKCRRAMLTTPTPATTAEAEIPEGWKLVPIESTSEMDIAGMDSLHNSYEGYIIDRDAAETVWNAMLEAAPTPPTAQGGEGDD